MHSIGIVINFSGTHWALVVMDKSGASWVLDSMGVDKSKMSRIEIVAKLVRLIPRLLIQFRHQSTLGWITPGRRNLSTAPSKSTVRRLLHLYISLPRPLVRRLHTHVHGVCGNGEWIPDWGASLVRACGQATPGGICRNAPRSGSQSQVHPVATLPPKRRCL
jgi:hypothetical protein